MEEGLIRVQQGFDRVLEGFVEHRTRVLEGFDML